MPWVMEADGKTIGMTVWDEHGKEHIVLEEGERKVIMTGGTQDIDGMRLAQKFCEKYVIPQAEKHGASTKIRVLDHESRREWHQIIEIFMGAPADMFWPPDELWIYNTDDGERYYPHLEVCINAGYPKHQICKRCRCHCDCTRRSMMAREAEKHATWFAGVSLAKKTKHNDIVDAEMDLTMAKLSLVKKMRADGRSQEDIAEALDKLDKDA